MSGERKNIHRCWSVRVKMDLFWIHWLACEKATKCIANPLQYSYVDFLHMRTMKRDSKACNSWTPSRVFIFFLLSNNATFVDWNRLKCCKKHHKNAKSELKRLSHNLSTFEVLQIRFAIIQFPGFESTLKAIFNDEIYCIDALSGLNENALLT